MTTHDEAVKANKESAERLAKQMEKARAEAEKGVDARLAAKEQSVADFHERTDAMQPTPTQRENDLARVGALSNLDEKEDDGSEWEDEHITRVMSAKLPGNNPYETRDMEAAPRPRKGRKSK